MSHRTRASLELERAVLRRAPLPSCGAELEIMHARYVSHRFAPHWHDEYAVGVVEAGAARTRVGSETLTASAGQVVVLEPGVVHAGGACDPHGVAYRVLYVPAELMAGAAEHGAGDVDSLPAFGRSVIDDPTLAERLRDAHAALMRDDAGPEAERALLAAVGALRERWATGVRPSAPARPWLARVVREYLEAHHARVVTLAELARLTRRSPYYLSRTFRRAFGVPPYAYLALWRVRRARQLLAGGLLPSVVAHTVGFADQSHFIRQFKRVVGVTPGQYARAVARPARGDARRLLLMG